MIGALLNRLGAPHLLVCAAALVSFGLVMVYSSSAIRSELVFGSGSVYLVRQLGGVAAGVAVAVVLARLPLSWLRRFAWVVWGGGVVCVALTLTPLGIGQKGAVRWLGVGTVAFQPLELMKLGLVLALAHWLATHESELDDIRLSFGAPAVICGVPAALLLLQPDFGGAMMLALFTGAMIFVAGAQLRHLALASTVALPLVALIAVLRDYRVWRLKTFFDPWEDPLGHGYQLVQSLLAFGAGGFTGTGLGSGQQKLGYLPEAHTDFILSVVGEEVGLVGVCGVLIAFALLGLAALSIASRGRDSFALLVAFGASLMLWLQGLVNAGVTMAVLPPKGTTLPLFSYGRSSLIASMAAIGLLLNVARPSKRGRRGWR